MIDRITQKIKRRISSLKEFSAKGSELKYWQKTGLSKGNEFYEKYLDVFQVSKESLADKRVGDFGCGPFGGILSIIDKCRAAYPIDILADEYNEWKASRDTLIKFDGVRTRLPDKTLDVLFMTNVIDHTRYPKNIIREARRILSENGNLYLYVNLRSKSQLNKGHPVAWDENKFLTLFKDYHIDWYTIENTDIVNGKKYQTLYGKLTR